MFKRPLAIFCAALLAQSAWALDPALMKKAEELVNAGRAEEAYDLLEPQEISEAGDVAFDVLLAKAAMFSGKPSKATFIYERILAVEPDYVGARADMGRAYFMMGDYGRAKIEFETVLSIPNLPADLRQEAERYNMAAEARIQGKKTIISSYIELGYGADSNIGSATSQTVLTLPVTGTVYRPTPPTGTKTGDNFATLALGGEVNHQLSDHWAAYAGVDYRIRDYSKYNDPNNWTLDGRTGVSYSSGAWQLRTGLTAGTYYYYGAHLRDTLGLTADWRMALDNSNQLTLNGSIVRSDYIPSSSFSQGVMTYTGTVGWLTVLGSGATVFSLTGSGGHEDDLHARDDGNRRFFGPRLLLQTSFNDALSGYVTGGVTRSDYGKRGSYYTQKRSDTLYDATAALSWVVSKGITLRPQVSYYRNATNADLYAYEKVESSLNLRFDY